MAVLFGADSACVVRTGSCSLFRPSSSTAFASHKGPGSDRDWENPAMAGRDMKPERALALRGSWEREPAPSSTQELTPGPGLARPQTATWHSAAGPSGRVPVKDEGLGHGEYSRDWAQSPQLSGTHRGWHGLGRRAACAGSELAVSLCWNKRKVSKSP